MKFSRIIFKNEQDDSASNFTLTRTLISTGWPLRKKGDEYWELLCKRIKASATLTLPSSQFHSDLLEPAKLLYYGGAPWCPAAEQSFTRLIQLFPRGQLPAAASSQEDLFWLIRILESKSLCSLQQLCVGCVRKALGMDLLHKVSHLAGLLPELIRDRITLKREIGEFFAPFLERNLMYYDRLALSNGEILSMLFCVLESPPRLFRPLQLTNGQIYCPLDVLALRIPSEYVDPFLRLLAVCINTQDANSQEMEEIFRAALNCAIQQDCKELVQYLLDKLCQTGTRTIRAGRSSFPLARVVDGAACNQNPFLAAAMRSCIERSEPTCKISSLVVSCLADSSESLELIRANDLIFDLSQVLFPRLFLLW